MDLAIPASSAASERAFRGWEYHHKKKESETSWGTTLSMPLSVKAKDRTFGRIVNRDSAESRTRLFVLALLHVVRSMTSSSSRADGFLYTLLVTFSVPCLVIGVMYSSAFSIQRRAGYLTPRARACCTQCDGVVQCAVRAASCYHPPCAV